MQNTWNIPTLARKLNVTPRTVFNLLKQGKLSFGVKVGHQWRFRPEDVERMFQKEGNEDAEQRQTPPAAA